MAQIALKYLNVGERIKSEASGTIENKTQTLNREIVIKYEWRFMNT